MVSHRVPEDARLGDDPKVRGTNPQLSRPMGPHAANKGSVRNKSPRTTSTISVPCQLKSRFAPCSKNVESVSTVGSTPVPKLVVAWNAIPHARTGAQNSPQFLSVHPTPV